MTDGRVYLQSQADGSALELKAFNSQDGVALKLARDCGLRTGVITGRESAAMTRRARETELEFVFQGQHAKLNAYEEILRATGANDTEVAFVGDDLPDLPLLKRVGLAVAVANAVPDVKAAAHYVTKNKGGEGAIRETVELLLKSQGKWEEAIGKARA